MNVKAFPPSLPLFLPFSPISLPTHLPFSFFLFFPYPLFFPFPCFFPRNRNRKRNMGISIEN